MRNKNLVQIFVQLMFLLVVFATTTNAQTAVPSRATKSAEAASSLEIGQLAVTTVTKDSSAPAAVRLFVVRPNDRLQLDLRVRKRKTAESTLD